MKTLMVLAATLVASISLRATDIQVTDGGTFDLGGTDNVAENRLVFSGGATLTLTGAAAGENALRAQVVSDGESDVITLAVEDGAGKTLRFANHVSVKGTLAVTGFDAVKAGDTAMTPAVVDTQTSCVAAFPAFDVGTLASDVTIDGAVQLPKLPTGAGTLNTSAAFLALTGPLALGDSSEYDINCDMMIAHTNAFSWGATLKVANGKTLGYCPMEVASDYSWDFDARTTLNFSVNVVLGAGVENAAAQFHLWASNAGGKAGGKVGSIQTHALTGVISGIGDVKAYPMSEKGADKSAYLQYTFYGRQSFAGTLYCGTSNIKFTMGVPADGQVPFKLDLTNITGITFWSTAGSADYGCNDINVSEAKFGYYNTNFYPQRGQRLTVGTVSGGGFNVEGVGADLCEFVVLTNKSPTKVFRLSGVTYTLDAATLAKNNYYDIDNGTRHWYQGNGATSVASVSKDGIGVPAGHTMDITTVGNGKRCEVQAGATANIGTLAGTATLKVAATGVANVETMADGAAATVGDGATVAIRSLGGNNTITAGKNCVINVSDTDCDTLTVNAGQGSDVRLYNPERSWRDAVTLWVDASKPETIHSLTNASGVAQTQSQSTYCGSTTSYEAKAWWYDWRETQTRYYLYNSRCYYNSGAPATYPTYQGSITYVNPWYQLDGGPKEGMGFVHFGPIAGNEEYVDGEGVTHKRASGSAARLDLHEFAKNSPDRSQIPVAYVAMVYGANARSNMRGGAGLITDLSATAKNSTFYRDAGNGYGDLTTPMIANAATDVTIRKNGAEAVSGATATFNEGWQILGINMTGHKFGGVGFGSDFTCGGQEIAEMLVFSSMPSEADKARIEAYLSEKWGIPVSSEVPTEKPTLAPTINGICTVIAGGCDLDLSKGQFMGTVDVADGTVTLRDGELVPTAAELPQQEQILAWFDPSAEGKMVLSVIPEATVAANPGAEQTNEVVYVDDCRGVSGAYILASTTGTGYIPGANRRCHLVSYDHISGVTMPWIDHRNYYVEDSGKKQWGNSWRFYQRTATGDINTSDHPINFATAFIVQDSRLGGGSPILDAYTCSTPYLRQTTDPSTKLWGASVADSLKNGSVFVNGKQVADPMKSAEFTGGQEVLTVKTATGTTFPVKAVGAYNNTEEKNNYGATYGEIIFYGAELTEAERKTVESYLAWKWNGVCLHDTIMPSMITLDGSANVTVVSAAKMPSFAETYTGTVTLSPAEDTLAMTLDAEGQVLAGGFAVPGTVVLPSAVTVAIRSDARIRSNQTVKLASWGALGSDTAFSLDADQTQVGTRTFALRAEDDGLYLDVKGMGVMFLLK